MIPTTGTKSAPPIEAKTAAGTKAVIFDRRRVVAEEADSVLLVPDGQEQPPQRERCSWRTIRTMTIRTAAHTAYNVRWLTGSGGVVAERPEPVEPLVPPVVCCWPTRRIAKAATSAWH